MDIRTIRPAELHDRIRQAGPPIDLIDVRTPFESRRGQVAGARSIPLNSLDLGTVMVHRSGPRDQPISIGGRSRKACEALRDPGHDDVVNVEGGLMAGKREGLPQEHQRSGRPDLARFYLAAGTGTLVGSSPGLSLHPAFHVLAAAFGLMLILTAQREHGGAAGSGDPGASGVGSASDD